jgi:hypothetical protein
MKMLKVDRMEECECHARGPVHDVGAAEPRRDVDCYDLAVGDQRFVVGDSYEFDFGGQRFRGVIRAMRSADDDRQWDMKLEMTDVEHSRLKAWALECGRSSG